MVDRKDAEKLEHEAKEGVESDEWDDS